MHTLGIFCWTEQIKSWHLLGKNLKKNLMLLSNRDRLTYREIKKKQIHKAKRQIARSIKSNI